MSVTHRRPVLQLVAVLLALLVSGCGEELARTAPPELIGRWTTTDARYADRGFDISRDSIVFHTGGDTFTAHPIEGIARAETGGSTRYTVHYGTTTDEESLIFSFYLNSAGEIRFTNQQEMVWTRQ